MRSMLSENGTFLSDSASALPTRPLLVLALSDHPHDLQTITSTLKRHGAVVAQCLTAALSGTRDPIRRYHPDLILLDLNPDDLDPLALTKSIHANHPKLPIILFSSVSDPDFAARALRAGTRAYILKEELPHQILQAIEAVRQGGRYMSETIMQGLLRDLAHEPQDPPPSDPIAHLSDRELTVFRQIGRGHSLREIARELNFSVKTAATHRANIRRKLSVDSLSDLARKARIWFARKQAGEAIATKGRSG